MGKWVDLWVWECILVVEAVVLVGGQGTVICSGHWQVVIYKSPHHLLACGSGRASVGVCGSVQPHISEHCFQTGVASTSFDLLALLRWTALFF